MSVNWCEDNLSIFREPKHWNFLRLQCTNRQQRSERGCACTQMPYNVLQTALWEWVNPYTICTNWSLRHNGSRYTWSLLECVCVFEWERWEWRGSDRPQLWRETIKSKAAWEKEWESLTSPFEYKTVLTAYQLPLSDRHVLVYRCTEIGSVHVNHLYICEFSITSCCFTVCVCDCKCENTALPFCATQLPSKTMLISACVNYSDGHRYTNNSDKSTGTTSQHLHKHTHSHRQRNHIKYLHSIGEDNMVSLTKTQYCYNFLMKWKCVCLR